VTTDTDPVKDHFIRTPSNMNSVSSLRKMFDRTAGCLKRASVWLIGMSMGNGAAGMWQMTGGTGQETGHGRLDGLAGCERLEVGD
jgi:hypothetical protein